jgi:D-methionine transport system ATP-binding protein
LGHESDRIIYQRDAEGIRHKGRGQAMIEVKGLSKTFTTETGTHEVLGNIDLRVTDGQVYGIIGPSGAGKSTLVRCINLLERPTSGRVIIDGVDVTHFSDEQVRRLRLGIGMIFQDFNLFAQRTVLENVTFPLEIVHVPKVAREQRAHELLDLVGLADKAGSYPAQLSGGQQQRVAIARALVNKPSIILCDEATSALDTISTLSTLKLLRRINRELGVTLVVITHSMSVIEAICENVSVVADGHIIEEGTVQEIFAHPKNEITRQLLGKVSWDD